MRSNRSSFNSPQFRVLSSDQIEDVHLATLEVLQRTGIRVFHQGGIELLRKAGAHVSDGSLVRIPSHLAEWAIRAVPSRITIFSRDASPAMYLEDHKTYFGTGPSLPNIRDPYTGERRAVVKQDVVNVAKLVDNLPNIDYVMSLGIASDCDPGLSDREEFEAMVLNTRKPVVGWAYDVDGYADILEMGVAIRGTLEELQLRPFFVLYTEPTSPLQFSKESVDKLLFMAKRNLPSLCTPGVIVGASSPITSAAALVIANAEVIGGLVLAQLQREGSPCIYGGAAMPLDLKTTVFSFGAPEAWLNHAALADIAHYYRIPSWSFGGVSDSKIFDEQAALEGALASMMAALSGANLVHDVGYIEAGMTGSMEMVVVQNDVIGMLKRVMGGIRVDEEHLAVDLIDQIGPGGHFLSTDHTLRHYKECWYPGLLDRRNYNDWVEGGMKTLRQRAIERIHEILESHEPVQLPRDVQDRIRSVVAVAAERVRSRV